MRLRSGGDASESLLPFDFFFFLIVNKFKSYNFLIRIFFIENIFLIHIKRNLFLIRNLNFPFNLVTAA